MKQRLASTLAASVLAIAAGGCAHRATEKTNTPTIADNHKIVVTRADENLSLPVAAGDDALSVDAQARVDTFARLYVRQGHGALVLSAPTGSDNAEAAGHIAREVRMRLAGSGVPFAAIASSTYDGSERTDAPIILKFTRYNATAPTCAPLWSQDLAHASANQPWESFGCAQQANLAAMISDPADLLGPRTEDPRDAARRARVLEAYRQGQQTHAERSNDERVQVSDAVR
jgi:pilus assembly protein CpaD